MLKIREREVSELGDQGWLPGGGRIHKEEGSTYQFSVLFQDQWKPYPNCT
jgi:hypothetical protein